MLHLITILSFLLVSQGSNGAYLLLEVNDVPPEDFMDKEVGISEI